MPTIAETFALALGHHRAGNLSMAEHFYRQILQADSNHADSHHLLGVLAYQHGQFEQATASIRHALALNPSAAPYHTNLGLVLDAMGDLAAAAAEYQSALRLQPDAADAHNNLANLLQRQGRPQEAEAHCRLALQFRPDYPEAYNNLGNALLDQGNWQEAIWSFQNALRINPNYAEAYNNLGNALERQNQLDEAVRCYRQAVALHPKLPGAFYNLGSALERLDNIDEAIDCYQQALRLQPDFPQACNNLGIAFKRQDKLDDAAHWYERALSQRPDYAEAHTNLGNVRREQARFAEALACHDRALACDPDCAEAHFNRAQLLLLEGDFARGWPEYEWRWRTPAFPRLAWSQPRWDGSNFEGRTILLHAEQGLGDTLQFVRYVPLVKARGGRVILRCQPALFRLLAGLPHVDELVTDGAALPPFDLQAPLLSLPGIFATALDTVPDAVPYLFADSRLVESWRKELEQFPGFKIGIAWQGNPKTAGDNKRSIPLHFFAPLAKLPGVRLVSLQKGLGVDQLGSVGAELFIVDLGNRLDKFSGPFMDTAAVMKNLDLVISSDTAVPHLAGALGVPVWVALPRVPDWRWLLQRQDCPWYPTVRLFRQSGQGGWMEVFDEIAKALHSFMRSGWDCKLAPNGFSGLGHEQ